ncbi:hypothetical protein KC19_4G042900 [Ceratodon purpureus]|uniref:Uncharacterized protein n=1 Tax=Ceratodon purpureus TaxID=3225 RepID=A0A8T0I5F5_CERPU|nr:hypothetical protein KC19_4G042900 [Ceratodon purpureus]
MLKAYRRFILYDNIISLTPSVLMQSVNQPVSLYARYFTSSRSVGDAQLAVRRCSGFD